MRNNGIEMASYFCLYGQKAGGLKIQKPIAQIGPPGFVV